MKKSERPIAIFVLAGLLIASLLRPASTYIGYEELQMDIDAARAEGYNEGYNEAETSGGYEEGYLDGSEEVYETSKKYVSQGLYYETVAEEFEYFRTHACVVFYEADSAYYHHYDCDPDIERRIYAVEEAESLGYTPCPLCWESGLEELHLDIS